MYKKKKQFVEELKKKNSKFGSNYRRHVVQPMVCLLSRALEKIISTLMLKNSPCPKRVFHPYKGSIAPTYAKIISYHL